MKIRDCINRLPFGPAWFITRKTRKETLLKFLAEIRPLTTNHPLIRIGGDADGGYLVPDDVVGIA